MLTSNEVYKELFYCQWWNQLYFNDIMTVISANNILNDLLICNTWLMVMNGWELVVGWQILTQCDWWIIEISLVHDTSMNCLLCIVFWFGIISDVQLWAFSLVLPHLQASQVAHDDNRLKYCITLNHYSHIIILLIIYF